MKKRKTYEVSVINKTYSKTYSDQTKFYTSDTALELNFQIKEVEYDFDSAEIILLNVDDRSLVTRPVVKSTEGFTYELEDDIVAHYGEWKGQLKFSEGGEIYVSSPVVFRIENDLSNDRPPQLTEVNTWKNLRAIADGLITDIRSELELAAAKASEIEGAETTRQQAESQRQSAEQQRVEAEILRVERDAKREVEITKMKNDVLHYGAIKLVNIIKNGDFSKGLEGWSGVNSDLQLSTLNDLSLTTISNPQSNYPKANYNVGANIINGHIYYAGFYLHDFELSSTGNVFMQAGLSNYNNALVSSTALGKKPETHLSSVKVINSDFTSISISGDSVTPNSSEFITFSKVYLIDLTKAFGVGNEPSKEIIDWIISENGYFNELTLRRDDLQQYEINQLRKAVIALGGMI